VSSNHASAGTQSYGYNHANQRVFVRNANTVTYYLYGLGGERLMEFQETCTSGACTSYTETQRWIYFAGRKMFQKTGTALKAITPNRLASEAKHFPYGETNGPPPADTKDYFATYRRDGTGLDYAWNRYYSPTMGRFTTADPYAGSISPSNPMTWNSYAYAENNPANLTDRTGLLADICADMDENWFHCQPRGNAFNWSAIYPVYWNNPYQDGRWEQWGWAVVTHYGPKQGGAGGGGIPPVTQAPKRGIRRGDDDWQKAFQAINTALDVVKKLSLADDSDCSQLFDAVGVSASAFVGAVNSLQVINGSGSAYPFWMLARQNKDILIFKAFHRNYPGSVGSRLNRGTNVTAVAETPGNLVFFNPSIVNSPDLSTSDRAGTVTHELFHNITGLLDSQLQERLGLPTDQPSGNISELITRKCF
jgi:RHS repeat-associated protein